MPNESPQVEFQQWLDEWSAKRDGCGVQVAAYVKGKLVIDACAGIADPASGQPVDKDTLFIAQSCSKGVTATAIHLLVQQGKLAYDDPVAAYWPEFAVNGKAGITIRHVLSHQAGIPHMPKHADMALICDWNAMIHEMEQLSPIWEPGTKTGYHGLTYGWILAETAARADGRPFSRIVQEEISAPLAIASQLYMGAPPEAERRIAKISGEAVPIALLPEDHLLRRVLPPAVVPIVNPEWNDPAFHQAVIPAVNGVMTANALARMYASLIGDGVDGVRLLQPARMQEATSLQADRLDEVFQVSNRIALGYYLGNPVNMQAMGDDPRAFGNGGIGGMIGFADPAKGFSFAVLTNHMTSERAAQPLDVQMAAKVRELLQLDSTR